MVMFSVLVPVYNEEKMVASTISEIKAVMNKQNKKYEIIVIDDGSSDKSLSIMKRIKGLNVIVNQYNLGYGASLKKGLSAAKGEWIIISDADGTYPIKSIPDLLKDVPEYDMVVGSRVGGKCGVPFFRRPAKWFLNNLTSYIVGRKIPDLNSGLRVFRRDMAMRYFNLYPSGFSLTSTITMAALSHDYAVKYVPINYFKRVGKSSINPVHFVNFLILVMRLSTLFNPLKVFIPFSIVLFVAGIAYGIYQFMLISNIGDLPVMLVLAAVQVGIFGFIADAIAKQRK